MNKQDIKKRISDVFTKLYGRHYNKIIKGFIDELESFSADNHIIPAEKEWYKDAAVYSLYVDLFNTDFYGLDDKLDYLKSLGVNCLWLLPVLDSPMRDAGFDIKDFRKIRPSLTGGDTTGKVFEDFLSKARSKGLKVIFDIAVNHTSDEHPWFLEAKKSADNYYRNYYIFSKDDKKYGDARIIFEGIEESNWTKLDDEFYFHRFFDFQPDLNYRNPEVLLEMSRNFVFWLSKGVDGFRVDAIPYLWKEEGTDCENLPQTHLIIKFFRAVVDFVRPGTLLLAEACQKPYEVVRYFNSGDECQAGYHFPLMPQMFKMLAARDKSPVVDVLSSDVTPSISGESQWFTFLRCHDELSLELVYVSESDRKYIHDNYCKQPLWDFRKGQGISARLAELMDRNPDKIALIFSVMLTLPGTPVIYYGDEFGKLNDEDFYREQIRLTGKDDTRFLVRGRIDWQALDESLKDEQSLSFKVFKAVKKMLNARNKTKVFGRGKLQWLDAETPDGPAAGFVLAFKRVYDDEDWLVVHNLTGNEQIVIIPQLDNVKAFDVLSDTNLVFHSGKIILPPYAYRWFKINS
jgi:maltose alpha-D-glucosyltransferase/alpha-amylase